MNRSRNVFITGIVFVITGAVLVVLQNSGAGRVLRYIPLIVGVSICIAGGVNRIPGLYLPGVLLVGLGVGVAITYGEAVDSQNPEFIGIMFVCTGIALAGLPLLSKLTGWEFVIWPLPAALLILATGIGLLASDPAGEFGMILARGWQFVAALTAAYIVIVFLRRSKL